MRVFRTTGTRTSDEASAQAGAQSCNDRTESRGTMVESASQRRGHSAAITHHALDPSEECAGIVERIGCGHGVTARDETIRLRSEQQSDARKRRPSREAGRLRPANLREERATISTTSPGQRAGSMLSPRTPRRRRPVRRKASTAKASRSALRCSLVPMGFDDLGSFSGGLTVELRRADGLAARESGCFEHALVAESGFQVRLLVFARVLQLLLFSARDLILRHSEFGQARYAGSSSRLMCHSDCERSVLHRFLVCQAEQDTGRPQGMSLKELNRMREFRSAEPTSN